MTFQFRPLFAALEFGSLSMLPWLAAAVLPWLIHRWHRRQHRNTPWAAVDLLLAAMRERSRRIHLQQWLLLAVRTAILLLVALAAAEPALRQWALGGAGSAPVHRVLVFDQSYSMSCQQNGTTRLERAKARARRLVESADRGASFSIVGWGAAADNVIGRPTRDPSLALSAIDGIVQSHASVELATAIRAATAAIDRAEKDSPQAPHHQIFFFTDLAAVTWSDEAVEHAAIDSLAARSELAIVDVGEQLEDNLAVIEMAIEPAVALRQHEIEISATLRGFGRQAWDAVAIEWTVDGRPVDQQTIDVTAGSDVDVAVTHRFVAEGPHTVQVAVVGGRDGLSLDDRRWLVVDVRPRLRVACLAGKPRAADDLARALSFADGAIEPQVEPISRLSSLELADYDALILTSVGRLTTGEMARLNKYVRGGGALALFLGEQTDREQWNQRAKGLLPVTVGAVAEMGDYRFDPLEYRHAIVEPFRGRERSGLLGVSISQYVRLRLNDAHPDAETALAIDTGEPALVVGKFGLGRVAVFAVPGSLATRTATGTPWTSLAVSPAFVPIVRETVNYLVGDRRLERRNLRVHQPLVCPLPPAEASTDLSVRVPTGDQRSLPSPGVEDDGQLIFSDTRDIGVYSVADGPAEFTRFAVNLDGRDGDLAVAEAADLPASLAMSASTGRSGFVTAAVDLSFAGGLLYAATVLLLIELALAWFLGRGWG